ncbi:MAG: Asp-tRNA(Asn)/Glu-tRNA(Gln) amidotransferase subunit GatA [candidate division Zixibacteria bacterium]|nr:Asp-tRNA(Asn)/Glu-tRNA(Gln) amidotransferase subunit GatA [Candidatus Tariuqbacter arcticus]
MQYSGYCQIKKEYIRGENTPSAETNASFARIEAADDLNIFISTREESASREARAADQAFSDRNPGRLSGMTIAIKDSIAVAGEKLTCGSRILKDFISPYDATVVSRLREAGAVILGKTNQDEFAMGSSNENSYFGAVHNPWDVERVPGGSSGGSAAAVAAGLVHAALGSDTGGSVRQPAAFCGVVGLRPTYGRFSRYGLVAFASSMDQIGPLARSVEDAALISEVAAGVDPNDSTSIDQPVPEYSKEMKRGVEGMKVGLPKEYFAEGLDPEIRERIDFTVSELKKAGVQFCEISMPHTDYAIACYYIICTAEASSNLARYDGARYGYRAEGGEELLETYKHSRGEGFGTEVKRRIMLGTYVLSAGYYEAYYQRAQKVRRLITGDFLDAFEEVDLIIAPVTPTTAFKIGEKMDDPLQMYLSDIYTAPSSIAGIPGISVPVGIDKRGLPIGMGIMAPHFGEADIFRMGYVVEKLKVKG